MYDDLHAAMARLAGVCDFAQAEDGVGFSAAHAHAGHLLAGMPAAEWSPVEAAAAWALARIYQRQLASDGVAFAELTVPQGADALNDEQTLLVRRTAADHARDWRDANRAKAESFVRCAGPGETVILGFPYDAGLVSEARRITGRRYKSSDKTNRYPFPSLPAVIVFADAHGITVDPEVRAMAAAAGKAAPTANRTPQVWMDGETVVIKAPFNARLNAALRAYNGGRSTWHKETGTHRPPLRGNPEALLEIVQRFQLRLAPDVETAIRDETRRQTANRRAATALTAEPIGIPGLAADAELQPHQYAAVRFALTHRRVVEGDLMGLGKTLASLATVAADDAYPAIVVCRPSLTGNWAAEIGRWFPGLTVWTATGTTPTPVPAGTDVVVIGSAVLAALDKERSTATKPVFRWMDILTAIGPKALILDEGQDAKNRSANRTKAIAALAAPIIKRDGMILDLTGTAILNRPAELVEQLRILGRLDEFGGSWAFLERYCHNPAGDTGWGKDYSGALHLDELHDRLLAWGIMVRRGEEALNLPPLTRRVITLTDDDLDPQVLAVYRATEAGLAADLAVETCTVARRLGTTVDDPRVRAEMSRGVSPRYLARLNELRKLIGQAKREWVMRWVAGQIAAGEKVMIAAHHRAEVDAYATAFGGLRIQGDQPVESKEADKARFQTEPIATAPAIAVAIAAGGVGHTLTAARTGVQAELAWTPGDVAQMSKRIHRIGQTRPVEYVIPVAEGTVDAMIWAVIAEKAVVLDAVLDGVAANGGGESVVGAVAWELGRRAPGMTGSER